jgi:hypothetical protein
MGRELSKVGKRSRGRGVADEVQFIGVWPGADMRGFWPALIVRRINDSVIS